MGTFNLASADKVRLDEIMCHYQRRAYFGSYHYQIGTIDNSKAKAIWSAFGKKI